MLKISRVLTLPNTPEANTIYLVGKSSTELQLVVVGSSATDIRATILRSDVQSMIATAIAGLDQSNSALYAADIPARDALVLTKNSFVFVADATGDVTVKSGSAMYFGHVVSGSTTWTKVAEYESMDIDIDGKITAGVTAGIASAFPNKADLDKISHDGNGNMTYNGQAVGTVQAGTTEW